MSAGWLLLLAALGPAAVAAAPSRGDGSLAAVVAEIQPKIVKIYGAGRFAALEAYQSGILISADGHVLTVFSHVLDTDEITVILDDGRRFTATLTAANPRLEIALLKIDGRRLPYFDLAKGSRADVGDRVLAASNLFNVATGNEPASVQRGVVSAVTPLDARRGTYKTPYSGPIYVLDAMTNNPGAAGGALVNLRGELLGLLGKELRSTRTGVWLNYAVPATELARPVADLVAGRTSERPAESKPKESHNLADLGIVLVPDVLLRTPPFVDRVRVGSPAAAAGLAEDDLVVLVGDAIVTSCEAVALQLATIDRIDLVRLTVLRGQELVELSIQPPDEAKQ
jgi:serine protease Do